MQIEPEDLPKSVQNKATPKIEKGTYRGKEVTQSNEKSLLLLDRLKPQAISKETTTPPPQMDPTARIQRQMLPMIDLVEIKQWGDIESLKLA